MTHAFRFDPVDLPSAARDLRGEVRAFLQEEIALGTFAPYASKGAFSRDFSRKVGARGWLGMTWPKADGGHGRSQLERYVVIEEMLAVGAPVRAHWVADRQSGPVILRYGSAAMKREIIPKIVSGDLTFCIGLSEPGSGSDVFAASTKATKVDEGWLIDGRKTWTSNAHRADYMIGLFRTSPATKEDRRHGLSQFLVDMRTPGIEVRPVLNMAGAHDFNEVTFDNALVPDENLLGDQDLAWKQASAELAYERSGPDRFLDTLPVLAWLIEAAGAAPSERVAEGIGREIAHLKTLRRMSLSVAGMLQDGKTPTVEAALVKDLGTNWEQALPGRARSLLSPEDGNDGTASEAYAAALRQFTLLAPKMTIQGGTREVLRGIIARGLGLR